MALPNSIRPLAITLVSCLLCILLSSGVARAQTVDTFLSGVNAFDGMAFDAEGNLFATNYTFPGTGNLYKIAPDATVTVFLSGLRGAAGIVVGPDGFIYVAEYNSSTVLKVSPSGVPQVFAAGLFGPIGLDFDSVGNLYVQNFDSPVVHRVSPGGVRSFFASVPGYAQGSALAVDSDDNVYLTAYNQDRVYRITPDGTSSIFATGGSPGYGFIRWGDGELYLTGIRDHRIYSLCPSEGCVANVIAGTGIPGHTDGTAQTAEFDTPLGMAILPSEGGDVIYVGDAGNTAFRRITPGDPASVAESESEGVSYILGSQPNPFRSSTILRFQMPMDSQIRLAVFDVSGRLIRDLASTSWRAGEHVVEWDGLDATGREVEGGVYLYRLFVDGSIHSSRVIKLR